VESKEKKIARKVSGGQITKCYATYAFQWEKMFSIAIKDSDKVFLSYHFY
jgi:hypothetical protein